MISNKKFYCYYFTLFTESFKCVNKNESIMRVIVWCLQVSVLVFMCGCRHCWHVQSPGRKREWNLGLGLPGAPQAGPLTNTWWWSATINSPHTPLTPHQGEERVVKFRISRPPVALGHCVVTQWSDTCTEHLGN